MKQQGRLSNPPSKPSENLDSSEKTLRKTFPKTGEKAEFAGVAGIAEAKAKALIFEAKTYTISTYHLPKSFTHT